MDITLHNTQSGKRERFEPLVPGEVSIYLCGPTVYDFAHIGNAVPAVAFDVLVRLLRLEYPKVTFVRNITDVDDKINAAGIATGRPIRELGERYAKEYQDDIAALGVIPPDVEPRATGHIPEIVDMIETLIAGGHAYEAEGHVLFHVPSDPDYGTLAKRSLEDMLDGARVEVAPYKRDPKDFVLWKPSTPELPGWESPWGRGRPGWHIECSAMIRKHLGPVIDIHGGGSDLTFPHHENESAQSRCVNGGTPSVRYWLHNGMLTMGTGKMSKSVGNIVTIRELLSRHDGEVLRYALLSGHYRAQLMWNESLAQAQSSLDTLYQALRDTDDGSNETAASYANADTDAFPSDVVVALCNDLNTPQALAAMHALASQARRADSPESVRALRAKLLAGGWLLGILTKPVAVYFHGVGESADAMAPDVVEARIEERNAAREAKDFARADAIRDELAAGGIQLEDGRAGTRWRRV
ncbi:MAG: cysteine--tRNA ligase [Gammaproteobacteria bacterium]|nr:cysteine--tRNA ligase [Gammaproteobacteria bacterium]